MGGKGGGYFTDFESSFSIFVHFMKESFFFLYDLHFCPCLVQHITSPPAHSGEKWRNISRFNESHGIISVFFFLRVLQRGDVIYGRVPLSGAEDECSGDSDGRLGLQHREHKGLDTDVLSRCLCQKLHPDAAGERVRTRQPGVPLPCPEI